MAGQHRGPSDLNPNRPGHLVDPVGHRARAQDTRDSRSTAGPWTQTRVAWESGSTLRALGPEPEWPGKAGRPRRTPATGPSRQRHQVDLAGSRTRARGRRECWSTPWAVPPKHVSPGSSGRTRGPSDTGPCHPELVVTAGIRARPESSGTPVRHRGPCDQGPSRPGQLIHAAGHLARARGAWDSWSTMGPGTRTESRGRVCGHRGPSSTGLSRPIQVVEPAGPRTWARVPRDRWSTPGSIRLTCESLAQLFDTQALRHGLESPGTAGQHRGISDTGPRRQGLLVDPAGHQNRA